MAKTDKQKNEVVNYRGVKISIERASDHTYIRTGLSLLAILPPQIKVYLNADGDVMLELGRVSGIIATRSISGNALV